MITTEYIGFWESLMSSLLGMSIVFLSLIFLAIFVMIVSRVIASLEKSLVKAPKESAAPSSASAPVATAVKKDNKEAARIAAITVAIAEERREPVDRFVITNIQKM